MSATEQKPDHRCVIEQHVDPYLTAADDNYYCSACHAGMGNAYYHIRRKLEKRLAEVQHDRLVIISLGESVADAFHQFANAPYAGASPDKVYAAISLFKDAAKQQP